MKRTKFYKGRLSSKEYNNRLRKIDKAITHPSTLSQKALDRRCLALQHMYNWSEESKKLKKL